MKVLLYLFLFLLTSSALAEEKRIITGTKDIPTELNLMLKSYQEKELTNEEFQLLLKHIYTFDSLSSIIDKEELFFTIKSEIYKSILKFGNPTKLNFVLDDGKQLQKAANLSRDPFIKWMLSALSADAENIFNGPHYKEYLVQKNNGKFLTIDTKKISKRIQLIAKLFYRINPDEPDNLKSEINPLIEECLNNIEESLFLIASETKFQSIPAPLKDGDPLKLFKVEIQKPKPVATPKKSKSVEDIIDSTPENLEEEALSNSNSNSRLPNPSDDLWLRPESNPVNDKKLPKPSNDADWLQDF